MGFLVNSVPVRAAPPEGITFAELAHAASSATVEALTHAALPTAQITEAAGVPRQPGVNPVFQVLCQVFGEGEDAPLASLAGVEAAPLPFAARPSPPQAMMDLVIELEAGGGLEVTYMAELFDAPTVERLAAALRAALAAAAAAPDTPLPRLPLLDAAGTGALLQRCCCPPLAPERWDVPLLHESFEANAEARPDAVCLVDVDGTELRYSLVRGAGGRELAAKLQPGACLTACKQAGGRLETRPGHTGHWPATCNPCR